MKTYPSWRSNLALFVILIVLVAGYFFLQLEKAARQFQTHSREHSEVVAGVVELNIRNTISGSENLENIYRGFLRNSARFLHYLESIEPFTEPELTAFAEESGLAGVKIIRKNSRTVSGPAGWLPEQQCQASTALAFREDGGLYLLSYSAAPEEGGGSGNECIIVGVAADSLERMRHDLSLSRLLTVLNGLPGIAYVTFRQAGDDSGNHLATADREPGGTEITEHEITVGSKRLVVALEAGHYYRRMAQMRKELGLFVLFLLAIGGLTSWWLYRTQRTRLDQARDFERQLARQHEEAALGRAASTITHELRNPLNAIGIGLQRLQIEAGELSAEHRQLIAGMREAVDRSNGVITRLRQYIHDFRIEGEPVDLVDLLGGVLPLYRTGFDERNISVSLSLPASAEVAGERDLLGQLFDNLLRNAFEAQPDGGYLGITVDRQEQFWRITMVNGGLAFTQSEGEHLFEPYFTTKAKGTGLGLSISRKIVEAHGGTIDWRGDHDRREFALVIALPVLTVQT